LKKIESIVHPLVAKDRADFIAANPDQIVVLDTPLLFETGANTSVDAVVVVTIDTDEQKRRVLERGTMTEEQFEAIKAKQTPDIEKRARADYIVLTTTPEHAEIQVRQILDDIKGKMNA
jgi:dephospho-CoA kinase